MKFGGFLEGQDASPFGSVGLNGNHFALTLKGGGNIEYEESEKTHRQEDQEEDWHISASASAVSQTFRAKRING